MITYSFINLKGGVGKTTISINTAYTMAKAGLKVLFVDNDKQSNASMFFGKDNEKYTISNIFKSPNFATKNAIYPAVVLDKGYIDILPANMELLPLNMQHKDIKFRERKRILEAALSQVEMDYDVCIIDNAPDINFTVYNALYATNQVIIVTNPDKFAEFGVDEMIEQFDDILKDKELYDSFYNPDDPEYNFVLRGILLNKYVTNSFDKKKSVYPYFRTNINLASSYTTNKRLLESIKTGKSVVELSPRCLFSRQIDKFVFELLYMYK